MEEGWTRYYPGIDPKGKMGGHQELRLDRPRKEGLRNC